MSTYKLKKALFRHVPTSVDLCVFVKIKKSGMINVVVVYVYIIFIDIKTSKFSCEISHTRTDLTS